MTKQKTLNYWTETPNPEKNLKLKILLSSYPRLRKIQQGKMWLYVFKIA
jgi:hypothetical protein